ncbi:rhomboid family intramembrane serine protease [Roseovarius sp. SYSU LYC5161]|uniref:rhomboid family intramembrane serine protease n=1 Tax=Roseovarius halophilus (ex Wu et al. 2025) TaxID=3376060 RepID=UPI0028713985|nr:rhomboid family intramembrane serine protease [Roseovarius sp.]
MASPETESPVNPLPPVVAALFIVIIGVEAAFTLGARGIIGGPEAVGWRNAAIQSYAVNSDIIGWMFQNGVFPGEHMVRFVSYAFVHGTFTHALFAGVLLLALGKFVGEVFSQAAVLALFLLSGVAGAVVFGLVGPAQPWLIGAFPGVYGLIGGFTYLMWLKLGQMGAQQYRAFTLIGVLLLIQLIFGVLFGGNSTWIADISGFAFGFLMSFFLAPGGWARLRARIRHK